MKRDIIRMLVKRIEINQEEVTVIFRVNDLPVTNGPNGSHIKVLQDCPSSPIALARHDICIK